MATGSSSIQDTSESENQDGEGDKWKPCFDINPEDSKVVDEKHIQGDNLGNETNVPPQLETDPDQKGEPDEGTDAADDQIAAVSESSQDKNGQNITHSNPKGPDNSAEAQKEETKTSIVEADNKKGDSSDSELDYHNVQKGAPLYTQTEQKRTTDEDGEQDESEEETPEEMEKKQNSHVDSELQNDPALPSVDSENYNSLDDSWVAPSDNEIKQLEEDSLERVTTTVEKAIRKEVKNCRFFQKDTDKLNEFAIELSDHVKKMLQRYCTEEKRVQNNGGARDVSQTAKSSLKTLEIIPDEISIVEFCIKKQKLESIKKNCKIEVNNRKDGEQIIGWKLSGQTADVKSAAAQLNQFLDGIVVHQEKHIDGGAKSELAKKIQSVEKNGNVLVSKASSERTKVDVVPKRGIVLHGWRWDKRNGQMITLIDGHHSQIDADFILIPRLGLEVDQDFGSQPDQSKRHVHFTVKPLDGGKSGGKKHLQDSITSAVKKLMEKQNCKSVCIPLDFAKLVHWQEEQFLKSVIFGLHSILPLKLYFTTGFSANGFERAVEVIDRFQTPVKKEPQRIIVDDTLTVEEPQRNISISVCEGKIVDSQVDVLVNLTQRGLKLDKGFVSGSILEAAGMAMQIQCNTDYPKGIQFGEVAQTDSYKMNNCRKVFHGVLPGWTDYESLTILSSLVTKCLRLANRDGMKSIAFPALGTGRHGYAVNDVARVMIKTILEFDKSYPDNIVKDAQIVCERDTCRVFQTELEIQVQNHKGARYGKKIRLSPKLKFYLSQANISVHSVDGLVIFWHKNEVFNKTETKQYLKEVGRQVHLDFLKNRQKISQCREPYVIKLSDSLPYRYIIHRGVDDYRSMNTAVQSVLQATEEKKLASVCIVFLSTDCLMLDPASKVLDDFVSSTIQFDKTRNSANLETVYIATDTTKLFEKFVSSVDACLPMEPSLKDPKKESQKSPELVDITVVGQCEDVQKAVEQLTGKKVQVPKKRTTTSTVPANQDEAAGPQDNVSGDKAKKEEPQTKGRPALERTDEEKCCVILKINDETKLKLDAHERKETIKRSIVPTPYLVVHPFNNENEALLKYSSPEDIEALLKKPVSGFELSAFPPQGLNTLKAYLTPKMMSIIKDKKMSANDILENTGAEFDRDNKVLEGNLLEIQWAHTYFAQIAKEFKKKKNFQNDMASSQLQAEGSYSLRKSIPHARNGTAAESLSRDNGRTTAHSGPVSTSSGTNKGLGSTADGSVVHNMSTPSRTPDVLLKSEVAKYPDVVEGSELGTECSMASSGRSNDSNGYATNTQQDNLVPIAGKNEDFGSTSQASTSKESNGKDVDRKFYSQKISTEEDACLKYLYRNLPYPSVHVNKNITDGQVQYVGHQKDIEEIDNAITKTKFDFVTGVSKEEYAHLKEVLFPAYSSVFTVHSPVDNKVTLGGSTRKYVLSCKENVNQCLTQHRSTSNVKHTQELNQIESTQVKTQASSKTTHEYNFPVFSSGIINVVVLQEDLLKVHTDAICNPYDPFNTDSSLSKRIIHEAGKCVKKQCKEKFKDSLKDGQCVETDGGKLKCKHILHGIVPDWGKYLGMPSAVECFIKDLQKVLMAYLYKARGIDVRSVALPTVCTGRQNGAPVLLCFNVYQGCVKKFIRDARKGMKLKDIQFVDLVMDKVTVLKQAFQTPIPSVLKEASVLHFCLSDSLLVHLSFGSIFEVQADALAVSHDSKYTFTGHVAKQMIDHDTDGRYKRAVSKGKGTLKVTPVPISLTSKCYKHAFNTEMPNWSKGFFASNKSTFKKRINEILEEADKRVDSIAFPAFGGAIKKEDDRREIYQALIEIMLKFSQQNSWDGKLLSIHIAHNDPAAMTMMTDVFKSCLSREATGLAAKSFEVNIDTKEYRRSGETRVQYSQSIKTDNLS